MYAVIFWRTPVDDDDVVRLFEETSIIFTLRRDHEAEKVEKASRSNPWISWLPIYVCRLNRECLIHNCGPSFDTSPLSIYYGRPATNESRWMSNYECERVSYITEMFLPPTYM